MAWRVLFIGWAASWLPAVVDYFHRLDWLQQPFGWWCITALPLVLLIVVAVDDWRKRRVLRRHWSHWTGVCAGLALMSIHLLIRVVMRP